MAGVSSSRQPGVARNMKIEGMLSHGLASSVGEKQHIMKIKQQ
jgi:hypothetical protein